VQPQRFQMPRTDSSTKTKNALAGLLDRTRSSRTRRRATPSQRRPRNAEAKPARRDNTKSLRARVRGLLFEPEGQEIVRPAPPVPPREIFRFFWPYARPYRGYVVIGVILSVVGPAVEGVRLYMIKLIVDGVLVPQDLGPLVWIAPTLIGLTLVNGVLTFSDSYLTTWVGERFLLSLRTNLFRHLQGLSLDFFERRQLGDMLSRLTSDTNAIESLVLSGVSDALSSIVRIVFFSAALFYIDWKLALVTLVIGPGFAILVRRLSTLIKRASREKSRRSGSMTAVAEESLANVPLVQAYSQEEAEIERFHRQGLGAFTATMVATRLKSLLTPLIDLVQAVSTLGVIVLGTVELADGRITLGSLLLLVAYLNQLYTPMRGLAKLYNVFYSASAGSERVIEFFRARPTIVDRPAARQLQRARGLIEFDGVSFHYPGTSQTVLSEISLRIEPGQTLALVGHSGAGKTTLAKLLLRFYDASEGAIRLDGHDLRDLQLASLRRNIAVLLQETLILDTTIRENILYGRPGATEEELIRAARAADAHEFVSAMQNGYDTPVAHKGRRLSGGQRQRIAIARAMLRNAPILILDEPTTGLDAESGHRILEPLHRLMSDRTTIVISHNLMTVHEADWIVLMDNGRIGEQGTHTDLVARDGTYARLCRLHEFHESVRASGELGMRIE
jgi:ATP-binding cassette, subfamily B, bacterial